MTANPHHYNTDTQRLYYEDPYLTSFTATVTAVRPGDGQTLVALDRTAFYPTGGGQPHDTGTIDGQTVQDVIAEDGLVWHALPAEARLQVGQVVQGEVDFRRRFDHMQQHAGQHILSAALERLYGYATVGFHLGTETVTIDIATDKASPEELQAAEDLANQVIWQDLPIAAIWTDDPAQAPSQLRKLPAVPLPWRLVQIGEFDICPCGGTHPRHTGEIGSLFIVKTDRAHGVARVHFVAGGRALRFWREEHAALLAAGRQLSVGPGEVPTAVERMLASNESQAKAIAGLQAEFDRARAALMRARAPSFGTGDESTTLVVEDVPGAARDELKALAVAVVAAGGTAAVLTTQDTNGGFLVMARSQDRPWDLREPVRQLTQQLPARGGGSPSLCQLSLPADDTKRAMDMALAWLMTQLPPRG